VILWGDLASGASIRFSVGLVLMLRDSIGTYRYVNIIFTSRILTYVILTFEYDCLFWLNLHAALAMDFSNTKEFYAAAGARIKEARGKSITQEQLAKAAGISRVSMVNIEAGRQKLLLHHALVIADALGLSLAELVDPLIPKVDEELDLSGAGDAASFVRLAMSNLSQGTEPNSNV